MASKWISEDQCIRIAQIFGGSVDGAEEYYLSVRRKFHGYPDNYPTAQHVIDILTRFSRPLSVQEVESEIRFGRRPMLDQTRIPIGDPDECPHGVPRTQPCAICNEKEFKFLTGI